MLRRLWAVLVVTFFLSPALVGPSVAADNRTDAEKEAYAALLASITMVEPVDLLKLLVADRPENDPPPAMLAHLMYLNGNFNVAAFYFKIDYGQNPDNIESLSNLAGIMVELHANDPDRFPASSLDWALELARKAAEIAPENAGAQNTLAFVARANAVRELDARPDLAETLLQESANAAGRATGIEPERAIFWTNLARAEYLKNNPDAAGEALRRAKQAEPDSPTVFLTAQAIDQPVPEDDGTSQVGKQCNVDFKCEEICPKSIIGQVNFVSCKLENATQQSNCKAGKPYATAFNCEEEFPVFGATPGLSNKASICIPGVCFHISLKGNGDVDIRVEGGPSLGPIKAVFGADVHYSNNSGFSVDRFGGGVKFSLFNKSAAGDLSGKISEINPVEVKISSFDGKPATLKATAMGHGLIEFQ